MEVIMANEVYTFSFTYWQRSYGWTLLRESVRLLIAGRCRVAVNMELPDDVRMLKAAMEAAETEQLRDEHKVLQARYDNLLGMFNSTVNGMMAVARQQPCSICQRIVNIEDKPNDHKPS
jgi:hypothetical protein